MNTFGRVHDSVRRSEFLRLFGLFLVPSFAQNAQLDPHGELNSLSSIDARQPMLVQDVKQRDYH